MSQRANVSPRSRARRCAPGLSHPGLSGISGSGSVLYAWGWPLLGSDGAQNSLPVILALRRIVNHSSADGVLARDRIKPEFATNRDVMLDGDEG